MQYNVILTCLVLVTGATYAQINPPIPVPVETPGQRYPHDSIYRPNVKLEVFIELVCSDSAQELPVLEQVADHYGASELELIIQQLPLPYHRNGMIATQVNLVH